MARGRDRAQWNHTAAIMAHQANLQRSKRTDRVWHPSDFSPYATTTRKAKPKISVSALRDVFIFGRTPRAALAGEE